MLSIVRVLAVLFVGAVIGGLLMFSDHYGDPDPQTNVVGNILVPAPSAIPPTAISDDENEDNVPEQVLQQTSQSPNTPILVEGVYARASSGKAKDCSLSAYLSLALRKVNGSLVVIGDDDPRFEATYPFSYDPDSGNCSFKLDEGAVKYYYTCEVSIDSRQNKPKIRVTKIRTVLPVDGGSSESTCDDGEEFILR